MAAGGPVDLTSLAADPHVAINAIVDPCGGNVANTPGVLGNGGCAVNTYTPTQFAGTSNFLTIPANRLNPTAKSLMPILWPAPTNSAQVNNFMGSIA